MKNEDKFVLESISSFLGNYNPQKLKKIYESCSNKTLSRIIKGHNIGGFFYYLYLEKFFNNMDFPDGLILDWKNISGKNILKNIINDEETFKIIALLNENAIDYIYLKGVSTRQKCYYTDYIKSSVDIDLFIKKADYKKVKKLLLSNGYEIPYYYYIEDYSVRLTFEQYEECACEISFVKKNKGLIFTIDLQWDFIISEDASIFHKLYGIESFYNFDYTDEIIVDGHKLKVFSIESELINIAIHFIFNHGFRGLQWLIDICQFLRKNKTIIDFELIGKKANANLKKIIGIVLMLAGEFNPELKVNKHKKKMFCLDRLLPFEYFFYKSMLFKPCTNSVLSKVERRIIKILLPYKISDRIRVIRYLFFNIDSIRQRLEPQKQTKSFLLPYYLFKLFISDIMKKNKK